MDEYIIKIIEIEPCTRDEGGPIIDAKVKIQLDNNEFWCFIPDWRSEKWSLNDKGKRVKLKLSFVYFTSNKISSGLKKLQSKDVKNPEIYNLSGIITKIEPYIEDIDIIWVDCGIILPIKIKKGKFIIHDNIQAEGRLDAFKIE